MPFKTKRQARYEILIKSGFLRFEARTFSAMPLKVPYIDVMLKQRRKELEEAREQKLSRQEFEKQIKQRYIDNDWFEVKHPNRYSPHAMLREFEHSYKQKHPEYESPWKKRKKFMKDYIETISKDIVELPSRPLTGKAKEHKEWMDKEAEKHFRHIRKQQGKE